MQAGMGLHVAIYTGGERAFAAGVRGVRHPAFREISLLGTDGRHGESIAQLLGHLYGIDEHVDEAELRDRLAAADVSFPDYQARMIADVVRRCARKYPAMELAEVAANAVIREAAHKPILLSIDNLGLGHIDLRVVLALAKYAHAPVMVALHLNTDESTSIPSGVQRLARLLGNRVVSLAEPRIVEDHTDEWLQRFERSDVPNLRDVALAAALLGRVPDPDALADALFELDIFEISHAQRALQADGVLTSASAWQFNWFADVDALRRIARAQASAGQTTGVSVATACVRALYESANANSATRSEVLRFAEVCEMANEADLALLPLRRAALGFHLGEADVMHELMARHEQLLGAADRPSERLAQEYVGLRADMTEGLSVRERALELYASATMHDLPNIAANAQRVIAIAAWDAGREPEARAQMTAAAVMHAELLDWTHAGQDHLMLGWWNDRKQNYDLAFEHYEAAIEAFQIAGEEGRVVEAQALQAISLIAQSRLDEAEALLDATWQAATVVASSALCADILNSRSEIARAREDWELAYDYATQAHAWFELIGHRYAHIAAFNKSLIAMGAQRYGESRALLEGLRTAYPTLGLEARLPLIDAALAICALAWRDVAEFEHRIFLAEAAIAVGFRHADLVWILKHGAMLAAGTEQDVAAARISELQELFTKRP
ncbi:MAG: hypothetical protein R3E66_01060 [bacterium]